MAADLEYPLEQQVCRKFFGIRYESQSQSNCVCGAHREYTRWLRKYELNDGDLRGNLYEVSLHNMPSRCRVVLFFNITNRKLTMMQEVHKPVDDGDEVVDLFPITYTYGDEEYQMVNAPTVTERSRLLINGRPIDFIPIVSGLKEIHKRVEPKVVATAMLRSRYSGKAITANGEFTVEDARFLNRLLLYLDVEMAARLGDYKWSPLRDFPLGMALTRAFFLQQHSEDYRLENVFAQPGLLSVDIHSRLFELKLINYRYRIFLETSGGRSANKLATTEEMKAEMVAQFCGPAEKYPCFTRFACKK